MFETDHFSLLLRVLVCLPGGRAVTAQEDSPQYNFSVAFFWKRYTYFMSVAASHFLVLPPLLCLSWTGLDVPHTLNIRLDKL